MSIDSKRWRLRVISPALAQITQRASGATRYVAPCKLPGAETLAAMTEGRFDSVMREAFHGAAH